MIYSHVPPDNRKRTRRTKYTPLPCTKPEIIFLHLDGQNVRAQEPDWIVYEAPLSHGPYAASAFDRMSQMAMEMHSSKVQLALIKKFLISNCN